MLCVKSAVQVLDSNLSSKATPSNWNYRSGNPKEVHQAALIDKIRHSKNETIAYL